MSPGQIGEFEVLSRIGGGGMADVYRCRRRGIGGFEKILAVKRIRRERAFDPEFVAMFLDEARLAANLNHPNIVQLFEMGEAEGAPYIAMEYVPGPTLARLLRKSRRDRRADLRHVAGHVARILADICEGLHHAHTAKNGEGVPIGLVHGDVSPQNIIVTRQGLPKLCDFGVAKATSCTHETKTGNLKGKLKYMAPEQLRGKVDYRSDLFSVGVCLFEATVGRSPFAPDDADQAALFANIAGGHYLRPSDLVSFYPRPLEEIILSALEPDPDKRCQSARELHDRLEEFLTDGPYPSSTRMVAEWVNALFPDADESTPPLGTPARGNPASVLGAVPALTGGPTPVTPARLFSRTGEARIGRPAAIWAGLTRHPLISRLLWLLGGTAIAAAGVVSGVALVRRGDAKVVELAPLVVPPPARAEPAPAPAPARTEPIPASALPISPPLVEAPGEASPEASSTEVGPAVEAGARQPVKSKTSTRARNDREGDPSDARRAAKPAARSNRARSAPARASLAARSTGRNGTRDPIHARRSKNPPPRP